MLSLQAEGTAAVVAAEQEVLLALLPPYRRAHPRRPAVEAAAELVLPAAVLLLGLFFSISTLVLLFQ